MRIGCKLLVMAVLAGYMVLLAPEAPAAEGMSAAQLVQIALEVNPQVRATHAQWMSALHSIKQNYAPSDPVVGFLNGDSPTNGFTNASINSYTVTDSFQFPGKALLQGETAKRAANIAHLAYLIAIRDTRAQTETAYYQLVLDSELAGVEAANIVSLKQVLKVTQVAYSAGSVTQSDFLSAEFDLAAARQQLRAFQVSEQNDETTLNQLLYRPPDEPLEVQRKLEIEPLKTPLDNLVTLASRARQEILQAALSERNSQTALKLAKFEYAPDYTLGYTFDHFFVPSFAPRPSDTQDHGFSISFNVPVFFWLKQDEDVTRAKYDLEAARDNLDLLKSQTAAIVTTLYRNDRFAYQTAMLYKESLMPLANQGFQVALVAYESGKIDFPALAAALGRIYDSRTAYLQASNQFLANEIALEQAIGEPLPK
ncbi:MAG: TolC family protein [Candidatus Binataceae bacterium]